MKFRNVKLSREASLVIVSGPCVIESEAHALETAGTLKEMFEAAGVQLIYKSSYDVKPTYLWQQVKHKRRLTSKKDSSWPHGTWNTQ